MSNRFYCFIFLIRFFSAIVHLIVLFKSKAPVREPANEFLNNLYASLVLTSLHNGCTFLMSLAVSFPHHYHTPLFHSIHNDQYFHIYFDFPLHSVHINCTSHLYPLLVDWEIGYFWEKYQPYYRMAGKMIPFFIIHLAVSVDLIRYQDK